jgi:hypothetical protein
MKSNNFAQRVVYEVAVFLSKSPYRFLVVLIIGFFAIGIAICCSFLAEQHSLNSGIFSWIVLFGYFISCCWYASLIRSGKWKSIWETIVQYLEE